MDIKLNYNTENGSYTFELDAETTQVVMELLKYRNLKQVKEVKKEVGVGRGNYTRKKRGNYTRKKGERKVLPKGTGRQWTLEEIKLMQKLVNRHSTIAEILTNHTLRQRHSRGGINIMHRCYTKPEVYGDAMGKSTLALVNQVKITSVPAFIHSDS